MIDLGFLLGFAFGCICTVIVGAALIWWLTRPAPTTNRWPRELGAVPPVPWAPHPLTRHLGAAARGEVADLAVSAGAFVSTVRSLRDQIDRAHRTLKDSTR